MARFLLKNLVNFSPHIFSLLHVCTSLQLTLGSNVQIPANSAGLIPVSGQFNWGSSPSSGSWQDRLHPSGQHSCPFDSHWSSPVQLISGLKTQIPIPLPFRGGHVPFTFVDSAKKLTQLFAYFLFSFMSNKFLFKISKILSSIFQFFPKISILRKYFCYLQNS